MSKKRLGYVELHWTCPNCGNENPGRERVCGTCGSPQPDDVEFHQAGAQELITDEGLTAQAQAGPDIHCPYCGTRNPAGVETCSQCGGDLSEGALRRAGRITGAFQLDREPAAPVACPHCGTENPGEATTCSNCGGSLEREPAPVVPPAPPASQEAPARTRRNPLVAIGLVAAAVLVCAVIGVIIILSQRTTGVPGEVQAVEWERSISLEALIPVDRRGWADEIPSGAEMGACEERVRRVQPEPAPNSVEVCGTPYTIDTGSGFGEVVQDCEYQVYENFCDYSVIEWQPVDLLRLRGSVDPPTWPDPSLEFDQRLGSERREEYSIVFSAGSEEYTYSTRDVDLFMQARPGTSWTLEVNTFGDVVAIEPR